MLASGLAFQSAFGIGASGSSPQIHLNAVSLDAAGDSFITGSFRGSVSFDPYSTRSVLNSGDSQDAFVARYSPTGSLAWVKVFSGRATDRAGVGTLNATSQGSALAVDAAGNVFVAGSFGGTVDIAQGASVAELTSPSGTEAFAAKLDASGNLAWVVASGGASNDLDGASGLALDGSGGVVIAGSFSGTATFGPATLTAGGSSEAYAAHLDGNGQVVWAVATRGSGTSTALAAGVAVDPTGNVVLAGSFSGTVGFDPGGTGGRLASAGSTDAAVWKLDPGGKFLWADRFGSTDFDAADAVALDGSGDVYATGAFSGTVNFGTATRPDAWTAGPIFNAFALKLDPSGGETWSRGYVGPGGWSKGQAIGVDPSGAVHIAGAFSGTVDFDPGPTVANLTSGGSVDVFATGLDGGGNMAYALRSGWQNANEALGLAVNAAGTVAIAGSDTGPISFGTTTLPAIGKASVFVARLTSMALAIPSGPSAPSAPVLESASDTGISQADGITAATSPIFDVNSADPANQVELLRNGVVVASRVGPGPIREPGPLIDGSYVYAASQVNALGMASPASPALSLTIDSTAPAAPGRLTLAAADDSGTVGDGVTGVRQPRLSGTAEPGSTVQVVDASNRVLATTSAAADGTFTAKIQLALPDGSYAIQARAIDAAGNVGIAGPACSLTILGNSPATPAAPSLLAADASGGPALTNVRQPRLTGMVAPGLGVRIIGTLGSLVASSTAGGDGVYVARINASLADGVYRFRVVVLDAAGNASAAGAPFSFAVLGSPPPKPATTTLLVADDSGVVGDGVTEVRAPRLVGIASPNARVDWINGLGFVFQTTTASATGSYLLQVPSALPGGTYPVRVRATDLAGNTGAISDPFNLTIRTTPGDSFGDGKTDFATYSTVNNTFYIGRPGGAAPFVKAFGYSGDVPISGDFFGLGHADVALYHPSTSTFYAFDAVTGAYVSVQLGQPGDVPVPADYDGDGKADFAVFRPGDNTYVVRESSSNVVFSQVFGIAGDVPVPADYFGTGHADMAVYRPSTSTFVAYDLLTLAFTRVQWGSPGDVPVPADYEGLGHADYAVYRPGSSTFLIRMSGSNALYSRPFGIPGDIPVAGDYFGDGRADIAVYRPGTSTFLAGELNSTNFQVVSFGQPGIVRPVLASITSWFRFGAGPVIATGSATPSPAVVTKAAVVVDAVPLEIGLIATPPATHKATTTDPAKPPPGLDGWRPGG